MAAELQIRQEDLREWRLIEDFRQRLDHLDLSSPRPDTWSDPRRTLAWQNYLCLYLFVLINPTLKTLRALSDASRLARVQKEISGSFVSATSFSEAQHLLDPVFLERFFVQLAKEFKGPRPKDPRQAWLEWLAQDSSVWRALPRMHWAIYGGGHQGQTPNRAVRLHLSFHVLDDLPKSAKITPGNRCERKVWKEQWETGASYIGDRYYGEDYQLFGRLQERDCNFIIRLRDQSIVQVEEELPVGPEDRAAGVIRQAWVRLGARAKSASPRVRVVWVQIASGEILQLVTNLSPEKISAELVARVYKQRWQIECFFRWIKYILHSRHWLAESREGVTTQLYLALIAGVLLHQRLGYRPNKRMMELIQLHLMGWATWDELMAGIAREEAKLRKRKGPISKID